MDEHATDGGGRLAGAAALRAGLGGVEFEEEDIAVLDFVVAAFDAVEAFFPGVRDGAAADEVIPADGFGFDEAFFEVGMDASGGLGGGGAGGDGPGTDFLVVEGEEGAEAEDVIGGADEGADAGFRQSQGIEVVLGVLGGQVEEVAFELGADGDGVAAVVGLGVVEEAAHVGVLRKVGEVALLDVGDKDGGFVGEEEGGAEEGTFLGGEGAGEGIDGFPGLEVGGSSFEQAGFEEGVFVAAFDVTADFFEAFVDRVEVGEDEFSGYDVDIAGGVDTAVDVDDVGVVEAADDLEEGVDLTDVAEELVAEALALGGALNEAGDIDEFERGGDSMGDADDLGEGVEPGFGHGDDAEVGVDGAERVVLGGGFMGADDRVEEGGFAYVGQADDSGFEHGARVTQAGVGAQWKSGLACGGWVGMVRPGNGERCGGCTTWWPRRGTWITARALWSRR